MIAYLEDWPKRNITQSFNVTQSSSELNCSPGTSIRFNYGDPPSSFGVNFSNETFVASLVLTPLETPFATDAQEVKIDMPSFVKYDYEKSLFSFQQIREEDFGSYFFGLRIGYAEYPTRMIECKKKVEVSYLPVFTGEEILDQ